MTNQVQELRMQTGAGVMDCKKALQDAGGDLAKAVLLIKERGLIKAEKKAERVTGAGLLESYIHNGRVGVLLELRCETDFVARTDSVKELARHLAMQVAAMSAPTVAELLDQPFIRDASMTVAMLIKGVVAKVGENLRVERFVRYEL